MKHAAVFFLTFSILNFGHHVGALTNSSFNQDIAPQAVRIHPKQIDHPLDTPIMVPSSFTKFRTKFILWNKSRTVKMSEKTINDTTKQLFEEILHPPLAQQPSS